MKSSVHVVDPDYRRRAQVARELSARKVHAEIYDGIVELGQRPPRNGCVFVADVPSAGCDPLNIAKVLEVNGALLPVVVYANQPTPERIVEAMIEGALDYLEWPFNATLLDIAFRRLVDDGARKTASLNRMVAARNSVERLTGREAEVLCALVTGLSNKGIAQALGISPRTVEIHRGNLMRKLEAQSTADAVRIALYAGLDEDPRFQEQTSAPEAWLG